MKDDPNEWMSRPHLLKSDKQILKSSAWLNCRLIDGCQQLLYDAFPQVGGLQPPYLWQKQQFKKVQGEFVQILNVYKSHWICVSNIGCEANTINVYDSAYATLDLDTKMQICSFWRPKGDYVTINMVNIQTQPNGCDCGVFAIANATELAFGKDPLLCRYDTEGMRIHFLQCLENRKMERFPLK